MKRSKRANSSSLIDVRLVARTALLQLLKPITEFAVDSGLSIQSLNSIIREVAIRSVASEHLRVSQRINFSGIAASTGIPRAEVARILKGEPNSRLGNAGRKQQHATNRILAAWHNDARFTTPAGAPADLKIYGRGATFEALVKSHGGGIPTRAILDELNRKKAIEIRPSQLVRFKEPAVFDRRFTPRLIEAFGSQGSKLLFAILQSMRHRDGLVIMKTVSTKGISTDAMAIIRREISIKGAELLVDAKKILVKATRRGDHENSLRSQINFAIVFHDSFEGAEKNIAVESRRNLRRNT